MRSYPCFPEPLESLRSATGYRLLTLPKRRVTSHSRNHTAFRPSPSKTRGSAVLAQLLIGLNQDQKSTIQGLTPLMTPLRRQQTKILEVMEAMLAQQGTE